MIADVASLTIGLGLGFGAGLLIMYAVSTRPLINALTRLRYDGFRPAEPPERPKTIPQLRYREED